MILEIDVEKAKREADKEISLKITYKLCCEIVNPLLPLHLSLQAFFGISRDENGDWVYFGRDEYYTTEMERTGMKKVNEDEIGKQFKENFPNANAFQLVKEAEWDFYAPIFDKIMPPNGDCGMWNNCQPNCDEENEEYDKEIRIAILLEKFIDAAKPKEEQRVQLEALIKAFKIEYGKEENEFIRAIRELCAILARTCNECKKNNGNYFGYKGKCKQKDDSSLGIILDVLGDDFKMFHCKLPGENDKPTDDYNILRDQLHKWGKPDYMNPQIVIQGIEDLADLLEYSIEQKDN